MSTETERKYLIEMPDEGMIAGLQGAESSAIVQTYLVSPEGVTERVRRRDYGDRVVCYHTVKRRISAMSAEEEERIISPEEYEMLLMRADERKRPIVKTRWCIPHEEHVAEIDIYPFWKHQAVLEIELESENTVVSFPSWLTLIREVTGDHAYSNNKLSVKVPEEDLFAFTKELGKFSGRPVYDGRGDLFVCIDGDDQNDGSREHPFRSLKRAIEAVATRKERSVPITVCVGSGIYCVNDLTFGKDASGSEGAPVVFRPLGDGEVVLSASVKLDSGDFSTEDGRIYSCVLDTERFPDAGMIYPVGSHGSWNKYDSHIPGINRELYINGRRQQLSRYPKEGFLKLSDVIDAGDCLEYPVHTFHPAWHDKRNHRPGEYVMDAETAERVKNWKHKESVWTYGYFGYDWASASCAVKEFRAESFIPEQVSMFGAYKGARYYFLNVRDELSPGTWYIDRETRKLYIYPGFDISDADIELGGREGSVIKLDGTQYLTIEGFTVEGARGNGIEGCAEHVTLHDLIVRACSGNGIKLDGPGNAVSGCELYDLGEGGIVLKGGDRAALITGGSGADNNGIHDFGLLFPSYRPGVQLSGMGNYCTHNEIYSCPHSAVIYSGNDLVIEYNNIHDAVRCSGDAGAIYSGRDWTKRGCSVSYNCVYRIGGEESYPDGIYFDDLLSGQTAHHNLLVDVGKYGFIIGGGRNNNIYNNIAAECGSHCLNFDSRGRDAYLYGGWAHYLVCGEDKPLWQNLRAMPYDSPEWLEHYPELICFSADASNPDSPAFAVNPSGCTVSGNLFIAPLGAHTRVFPDVFLYSKIDGNTYAAHQQDAGLEYGRFRFMEDADALSFDPLPLGLIGRY